MWELENTVLSHPPGTENDATRMSTRIKDISDELYENLMLARDLITQEQINEKRAAEDGVMRFVE